MARIWCRRMAAYMLRMILPTFLLSQLLGTVLFGRSDPDGICGSWIVCVSAVVVCLISVLSTRDGRSWAHRLLNLQVVDRSSLLPVSRVRMAVREAAHLADYILFIGFLRPLWNRQGQTFADTITNTVVVVGEEPCLR